MPRTLMLPTFAALSIAGAALGAQLGRSTVQDINPFWFSTHDQSAFFADLSAVKPSDDAPPPAISTAEVPITSCIGCTNWNRPDRAQYYSAAWVEETMPRAEARDEVVYDYVAPEEVQDPAREQVVRYASYQVSADDAAPEEEEAAAEPEDEAPAGSY